MIDKQSKEPEGIGRIIRRDGGGFADEVYKNGKCNGFSRSIYADGKHSIGQLVDGKLDGFWELYNLKGELYQHIEYSKNNFIKKW